MKKTAHKIEPIGSYLAEKLGSSIPISRALSIQQTLRNKGVYKPLGRIVAEESSLEGSVLEECLESQRIDILKKVALFASLPGPALEDLAARLKNVIFPPETLVWKPAEKAEWYYVVASGARGQARGNGAGGHLQRAWVR